MEGPSFLSLLSEAIGFDFGKLGKNSRPSKALSAALCSTPKRRPIRRFARGAVMVILV